MRYWIGDVFEAIGASGLAIQEWSLEKLAKVAGMSGPLETRGDTLVKHALDKTMLSKQKVKSVGLVLNMENGQTSTFEIPQGSMQDNTITFAGQPDIVFNYVGLLTSKDVGYDTQRACIEQVLGGLNAFGYKFIANKSLASDQVNTVLVLQAKHPDGEIVFINELLVKYGVCFAGSTGQSGTSGQDIARMRTLSNIAKDKRYGLRATLKDPSKVKNFTHTKDYEELISKRNSKATTNKGLELEFEKGNNHLFKIGDVWLSIPPTHITIAQMRTSYTLPLLGMEAKPLSTPVNRTVIKVNVIFTGKQVYDDMIRITDQFKYCAINMIRSRDVFNRVADKGSYLYRDYNTTKYIPVTMDSYTLYTIDGHPGSIACVLQFSIFNYSTYLNSKGLQYYRHDPEFEKLFLTFQNNRESVKTALPGQNPTRYVPQEPSYRLEDASHPYNAMIEDRLKEIREEIATGPGNFYEDGDSNFSIWKIDMDRYFNAMKGMPAKEVKLEAADDIEDFLKYSMDENPLFTELAHSISVSYNNIFAFQPIIGQQHPVAQYVGPGETNIGIDLKGIRMSTDSEGYKDDQKLINSLLKNYSEKFGNAEYGFFDDRYYITATLLNLLGLNIASIQNTTCTSVESKPGLFDVNILFSKSMFEYNLRNNPISSYDPYFGLRRLTEVYDNNPEFHALAKNINEVLDARYSTLNKALAKGLTLDGMHPQLMSLLQSILDEIGSIPAFFEEKGIQTIAKFSSTDPQRTKAYHIKLTGKDVLENIHIVGNKSSYNSVSGDKADTSEDKAFLNAIVTVLNRALTNKMNGLPTGLDNDFDLTDMHTGGVGMMLTNFIMGHKNVEKSPVFMEALWNEYKIQPRVNLVKLITQKEQDDFLIGKLRSFKSNSFNIATGRGAMIEFDGTSLGLIDPDYQLKVGEKITAMIMKVIAKHKGKLIYNNAFAQEEKPNQAKWSNILVLSSSEVFNEKVDSKDTLVKDRLEEPINSEKLKAIQEQAARDIKAIKPFSAHRYFPECDAFVSYNSCLSNTMGGWFLDETQEETFMKINRIVDAASKAQPWNRDAKLFDKTLPNSYFLQETCPELLNRIDMNNPLNPLAAIASPKMMRDLSAARDEDGRIISGIQFKKKIGMAFFGEQITSTEDQKHVSNQYFNSTLDWMMYTGNLPKDYEIKYTGGNPAGDPKKRMVDAGHIVDDLALEELGELRDDFDKRSGLYVNGNQANVANLFVPYSNSLATQFTRVNQNGNNNAGIATQINDKMTLVDRALGSQADIDKRLGGFLIYSSLARMNTTSMSINQVMGGIHSGAVHPVGVQKDKDGNIITDFNTLNKNHQIKMLSAKDVTQQFTGDKITSMLSGSYLQGLPATRGAQFAYPTYKMYIIKSDTSDYKWSSMDDYWDYRLVQDMVCIHDKNSPVHLLKARVIIDPRYVTIAPDYRYRTGVGGRLQYIEQNVTGVPLEDLDTTEQASRFYKDKAPLRQGMRICIKVGYHSDPRYLDTVFIGTITELRGTMDSGLYELAAEGDGRELRVPAVHFSEKLVGDNYLDIINQILRANPNVIHFGKTYGSFLRRLSYGHKNLMNMGMLGLQGLGVFGVGAVGTAVPGALGWAGGKKALTMAVEGGSTAAAMREAGAGGFSIAKSIGKASIKTAPYGAGAVAGGLLAIGAAWTTITVMPGIFNQASKFFSPAFDEIVTRNWLETDLSHIMKNNYHAATFLGIPTPSEFPGFLRGNLFNASKASYQLSKHFYQTYKHGNNPIDDNIYTVDIWNDMFSKCKMNISNKKSIWDVLRDIRRLYPNYALDVRPYGSRSTIFLGPVGFHYFRTDDPVQALLPQLYQMDPLYDPSMNDHNIAIRNGIYNYMPKTNGFGDTTIEATGKFKDDSKDVGPAPFVPFQKHHLITSKEDIIMNGLKPTPERGWNSVVCTYGDDSNANSGNKMVDFAADSDLYPESIRREHLHIDFTSDKEVATRYALGYLKEGVERLYGGTIIIKGNQKMEPYDKVYIADETNKMYGWVQVETVIHKFDQEMGFTTHIVPNMVCEINNNAYLSSSDIIRSTLYDRFNLKGMALELGLTGGIALGGSAIVATGVLGTVALPLTLAGLLYMGVTTYTSFQANLKAGKKAVADLKASNNTAFATELNPYLLDGTNSSKDVELIQNIVSTYLRQEAVMIGLKYGFALGYLYSKGKSSGLFAEIFKEGQTGKNLIKNGKSVFAGKISSFATQTIDAVTSVTKSVNSTVRSTAKHFEAKGKVRALEIENEKITSDKLKKLLDDYKTKASAGADTSKLIAEIVAEREAIVTATGIKTKFDATAAKTILEDFAKVGAEAEAKAAAKALVGGGSKMSKFFGLGKNVMSKLLGGGLFTFFGLSAIQDMIPMLGYNFVVNAVTKNNVILVSPIHWRDGYLMPSLDGYANNDTFTHISDMLVNTKLHYEEAGEALHKYMNSTFASDIEGKTSVVAQPAGSGLNEMNKELFKEASKKVSCMISNANLGLDVTSDPQKWIAIMKSVKENAMMGNVDTTPLLLALIYTESRFNPESKKSSKGAEGLCQIVPGERYSDGKGYDALVKKVYAEKLQPYSKEAIGTSSIGPWFNPKWPAYTDKGCYDQVIDFNITCMRKILDDKWTTKAKPALERDILQRYNMSNEKDIIFALYLYCAYNSMTEETRGFLAKRIDANGNVIKHEATDVEKDNSMMPILFGTKGNLGFLGVYMKFRNAFKICSGQATVQQAMASSKPEPNKTVATTNDTIVLRNRIANDAYEYVKDNSAKFKSANKSGKTGNIYTNDVDCSLFVSNVCKGVLAGLTNNLDTSAESKDPLFLALKKMGGVTRSTSAVMAANSKETPNPRPGDFVFFLDNGVVHHVEIYYGEQSKDGKIVQMSIGTSDKKDAVLLRDINRPPRVTKIHSFF